ncbi:MAG: MBL fold metallo-hydrolase [Ginsengibacter sp.]
MNQKGNSSCSPYFKVAPGVWGMKDLFVNIYMIQNEADDSWVLVDAGLKTSAHKIKKMASRLFGKQSQPEAIILTHGHFDHIGSLNKLTHIWHVPIYCHYLELPYLTGKSAYPPPDSSVGGGLFSWIAGVYPSKAVDLDGLVQALPLNGTVPGLKDWRYIHTPGHAPGHISLFRDKDKVLIAGDAFVTTQQESALSVLLQKKKISGPPAYFTYDWAEASDSVKKLKVLFPEVVATGHGRPMQGPSMRRALHDMHDHFYEKVVPPRGRYVNEPAIADASGVLFVPPRVRNYRRWAMVGAVTLLATTVLVLGTHKMKQRKLI